MERGGRKGRGERGREGKGREGKGREERKRGYITAETVHNIPALSH